MTVADDPHVKSLLGLRVSWVGPKTCENGKAGISFKLILSNTYAVCRPNSVSVFFLSVAPAWETDQTLPR